MNGYISYIDYVRGLAPGALSSDTGSYDPDLPVLRDRRVAYAAQQQSIGDDFVVYIDLGVARQIDVIGLLGLAQSLDGSPIIGYSEFRVSSTPAHLGDIYEADQNGCYRNVIQLSGGVYGRYVRVAYNWGPVPILKMGRIWIGPMFAMPFDRGWDWQPVDGNTTFRSEGSQTYSRKKPAFRVEEFTSQFSALTAFGADYLDQTTVLNYLESCASGLECLVCPNARTQHMINTLTIYGMLTPNPVSHLRGQRHTLSARIEECL